MTDAPFEYWQPGGEERRLRIFVSHRFGNDQALYDEVVRALDRNGFSVQDMSLSAERVLSGPRGGDLPKLNIQAEIAARIYTSDVVIAPSRPAVTRSQWVTWEVQLAAVGYAIPILFVNERNQRRRTQLVAQVDDLGLTHAVCDPVAPEIVRGVTGLVNGRPKTAMRMDEPDPAIKFRGPPAFARNNVLRRYPFQPRLTEIEPLASPPPKKGFWSMFSGGQQT